MDNLGLVSIITPSYNSSSFIAETIESILSQTYLNWELLITDDCSTDRSVEIIERYIQRDSRIKLFRLEKNCGAGVCRNRSRRPKDDLSLFAIVMIDGARKSWRNSWLLCERRIVPYLIPRI